jgi:hypothetical protein
MGIIMEWYHDVFADKDKEIAELKASIDLLREHIKRGMEPAIHDYDCSRYEEKCWIILEETKQQ